LVYDRVKDVPGPRNLSISGIVIVKH